MKTNTIKLDNGEFLTNDYGKYAPDLTFLHKDEKIQWVRKHDLSVFNLPAGGINYLIGDFFTSKKGTKCFRIKDNGKHILISDDWGGAFNSYRGRTLPKEGSLHYRRASSNGGGSGVDYAIYERGWKYTISLEDI